MTPHPFRAVPSTLRLPAILLIAGLLAAGCGGSERVETTAASPPAPVASGELLQTSAPADVVVYTASWCGWCQRTLAWLDERGVPYENRDIEVDPRNREELIAKSGGTGGWAGGPGAGGRPVASSGSRGTR